MRAYVALTLAIIAIGIVVVWEKVRGKRFKPGKRYSYANHGFEA